MLRQKQCPEKYPSMAERFLDITRQEVEGFAELLRRPTATSIVADMEKLTQESDNKRLRLTEQV